RFVSPYGDFKSIHVTLGRLLADRVTEIGLKSPQGDKNRLLITPGDFKPFQVDTDPMSATTLCAENNIRCAIDGTIYSPTGVLFRGFLIEARLQDASTADPYGTFSVIDSNTQTQCGTSNLQGLTHVTNSNKTSIDFSWTAPSTSVGDINFRLTVVESYNVSRYWLRIFSDVVEDCSLHADNPGCDGQTTPSSDHSTGSTQHVTSTTADLPTTAGSKIPYDPRCGESICCLAGCSNGGCDYLVSWQPASTNGNGDVQFDIKMMVQQTTNVYIAVGVSKTGIMQQTNIAACVSSNGTSVDILSSWTDDDYGNIPFQDPKLGLTLIRGSMSGSEFSCTFVRQKNASDSNYYDLSELMYMEIAWGPYEGEIEEHWDAPVVSLTAFNFSKAFDDPGCGGHTAPTSTESTTSSNPSTESTQHVTTTTAEITTTAGSKIPYDPRCGKTIGCFPECQSGCDFLVSWQSASTNGNGDIKFDIKTIVEMTTDVWIAVGLSKTGKMDQTNVAACVTSDGQTVDILSSHNEGYDNIPFDDPKLGLTLMDGSLSDLKFSCSFVRQKNATDSNFWDLSETLYLVVATGPFEQGALQQHWNDPLVSNGKVNFSAVSVPVAGNTSSSLAIQLHASLMVIAWVFFSSVGVLVARHCKSLVESETMCGVKYWFVIHRSFMSCAALCVIIAFVVIFIEVGGYSQVAPAPGKAFTKAHPILGIIVTALTVLNPLMALIRPAPDGQYRFHFNWAHFLVGTSGHVLAVVTIFIGVNITKANVNSNVAMYVMGAYVGVFVLIHLAMEIYNKKRSLVNNGYMKFGSIADNSSISLESDPPFLPRVLVIHVLLMAAAAFVMVYLIVTATRSDKL
ncbi:hypothetical protein DPMN_075884, partial [Dreissena polymorpha]